MVATGVEMTPVKAQDKIIRPLFHDPVMREQTLRLPTSPSDEGFPGHRYLRGTLRPTRGLNDDRLLHVRMFVSEVLCW